MRRCICPLDYFNISLLFVLDGLGRIFLDILQWRCACHLLCQRLYMWSHRSFLKVAGEGRRSEEVIGKMEQDFASSSARSLPIWPTWALIQVIVSSGVID